MTALDGKIGKVTAVKSDSVPSLVAVVYSVVLEGFHCIADSAFERVIGVYKKNERLALVGLDVGVEGLVLSSDAAAEGCDVAVSHRAGRTIFVHYSCKNVGCRLTSGNKRSLRSVCSSPRSVCPS